MGNRTAYSGHQQMSLWGPQMDKFEQVSSGITTTRCHFRGGSQMNKFEQVSSDHH